METTTEITEAANPSDDFEYQGVGEITCPWCGEEQGESWERKSGFEDEEKCVECGKVFAWEREVQVTYNSFRGDETEE